MDTQPPPKNKLTKLVNSTKSVVNSTINSTKTVVNSTINSTRAVVNSTKTVVNSTKDYLARKQFESYMKKEKQFYRRLSEQAAPYSMNSKKLVLLN